MSSGRATSGIRRRPDARSEASTFGRSSNPSLTVPSRADPSDGNVTAGGSNETRRSVERQRDDRLGVVRIPASPRSAVSSERERSDCQPNRTGSARTDPPSGRAQGTRYRRLRGQGRGRGRRRRTPRATRTRTEGSSQLPREERASRTSAPSRSLPSQLGQTRTVSISGGENTRTYASVTNEPQLSHSDTGEVVVPDGCALSLRREPPVSPPSGPRTARNRQRAGVAPLEGANRVRERLARRDVTPLRGHSTTRDSTRTEPSSSTVTVQSAYEKLTSSGVRGLLPER